MRVRHIPSSVVKPFGEFGGMGYGEGLAQTDVNDWRIVFVGDVYCADAHAGAGGNAGDTDDCGEDSGGAEAGWIFQPLLGCQAGEAMAGIRFPTCQLPAIASPAWHPS